VPLATDVVLVGKQNSKVRRMQGLSAASAALSDRRSFREPLGICRHASTVSANDRIAGSSRHEPGGSVQGCIYFLTDHQLGFALGSLAAAHELHRAQTDDAVGLDGQHH
jgi:hypothetical protein